MMTSKIRLSYGCMAAMVVTACAADPAARESTGSGGATSTTVGSGGVSDTPAGSGGIEGTTPGSGGKSVGNGGTPGAVVDGGGTASEVAGSTGAAGAAGSSGGNAGSPGPGGAAGAFVHPGTLDGKAELDFVKTQVAAGRDPWMRQVTNMKNVENLGVAPNAPTTVDANSGAADAMRNEARRTYGNALLWYLTGQDSYAQQAVKYLNAWAGLQSITATNDQSKLVAGWIGSLFGPAADLMLTYPGWDAADVEKFRAMLKRAFYPLLNVASSWNGNVDLHEISAMMAISVFCEDKAELDMGLTRLAARIPAYFYLASDGPTPAGIAGDGGNVKAFWSNPTKWVDGLTQETCRDSNHHAQFGMSGAIGAMETAWHQGVDVYSKYQTRMVMVMELMGLQCTSGSMQGTCATDSATTDVYDTWEIGYNHFHTRKGVAMPNTLAMITQKVRLAESNPGAWNIFYETLTHADIVYP